MVFKTLCVLVLQTKVASAMEGLRMWPKWLLELISYKNAPKGPGRGGDMSVSWHYPLPGLFLAQLLLRLKIKKCLFPITMLKKLRSVGRIFFSFLFYLPGRAVGGILVISICLLVAE